MEFSSGSANLVIDAYKSNNLAALGLPYEKEPNQLNIEQRGKLLDLGVVIQKKFLKGLAFW